MDSNPFGGTQSFTLTHPTDMQQLFLKKLNLSSPSLDVSKIDVFLSSFLAVVFIKKEAESRGAGSSETAKEGREEVARRRETLETRREKEEKRQGEN